MSSASSPRLFDQMTDGWSQVSPRDDFKDNALIEESRGFAAGGLDPGRPNHERFRSPKHGVLPS